MSSPQPSLAATHPDTTAHMRLVGRKLVLARVLGAVIIAVTLVLFVVALPVRFQNLDAAMLNIQDTLAQNGLTPRPVAAFLTLLDVLSMLAFSGVGILIALRRSDNLLAIFVAVMLVTWGATISGAVPELRTAYPAYRVWVDLLLGVGNVAFVTFLYIFPDGSVNPPWIRLIIVGWALWILALIFFLGGLFDAPDVPEGVGFLASLTAYGGSVFAQRYRREHLFTEAQVQQSKWVILGLGAALFGFIIAFLPPVLFPALNEPANQAVYSIFTTVVIHFTLTAIPVTIALSLLRYRLWDVDLVINRSLVFSTVTFLLGGVFFISTVLLQALFQWLTGGEQSTIALIASTLAIGALFQPARQWVQRLVDRRFFPGHALVEQLTAQRTRTTGPTGKFTGLELGHYVIMEPVGYGGMGEVYKGQHTQLNRPVAIKVLSAHLASETDFRKRFEREAQLVARLQHPNIVRVFDFGAVEDTFYMVMEYIADQTLSDYIRQSGRMSLDEARSLARDIASALDYAHEQGLVHRDVKPSNVMLQPVTSPAPGSGEFRAVLMDFGIAKIVTGETAITKTGAIGTLDYMAPEQIRAAKEVDKRADIYSLGVMLFQMLTGVLPFTGDNPGAVILAHLQQPAPDPRTLVPDLPDGIALAIMRALAKDPDDRQATAHELVAALT